jgi:hypothetical protein
MPLNHSESLFKTPFSRSEPSSSFPTSTASSFCNFWNLQLPVPAQIKHCIQNFTALLRILQRATMSSSHHPRPPSSSSSTSHHSQIGEPGPSRAHRTQPRPPSSGSSSSEVSHQSQVGQPGQSAPRGHSGPHTSSGSAPLKSHRSQESRAPGPFEPAWGPCPEESYDEVERDPLNGEKLEEMKDTDARAGFITERANFWMLSIRPPGVNYDTYRAAIEDARSRFFYSQVPKHRDFPHQ